MIKEKRLLDKANHFLRNNFNMRLNIPIERNNRLRSTLGRYVISHNGDPLRIELSGNVLTYGSKETIIGILKHECIHYAFHVLGKEMHDGDLEFELALKRYNAPSTNTIKVGKFYTYKCKHCKAIGETSIKRLVNHSNDYRTSCCKAPLQMIGEVIYQGI